MSTSTSKDNSAHGDDLDLSTVLTAEERVQLKLLIANITEVMQKRVADIFDASVMNGNQALPKLQVTSKDLNSNGSKIQKETHEEEKSRKMREKRAKELAVPKMLDLKKDAFEFFQHWRESVIERVATVVTKLNEIPDKREENVSIAATPDPQLSAEIEPIKSNTNIEDADVALVKLYPPTSTPLSSLSKEKRTLLLRAMLLLLLGLENYVAHSRILLLRIASSLDLPLHILAETETKAAQGLLEAAKKMSGNEETHKRSEENKVARRWKVGLAGVAGAAVIGITGGLAAPLVAGGIAAIMGGIGIGATSTAALLGGLAESGVIIGGLFGAYGGAMTGKMMDAYAKEVEDFAFLPLQGKTRHRPVKDVQAEDRRLRVTIGISGWLTQKEDIIVPWRALGKQSEVFALRWEVEALTKLGTSLESVVKSAAWSVAKKEIIARTIFASLMDALWPIALLKVSKIIDNPFSVALNRADKAGLVLADALINKAQGERPVTLIGYSLGARLIYSCLVSLAERRAFGLVESVVLMGTPVPSDAAVWRTMRSVVEGRLINVYSEHDYILAFLYRTSNIQFGVAGLQAIQDVKDIENVDMSDLVKGHLRYQYLVGSILHKIGFEDIDIQEVAQEEETLELLEEQVKKEREDREGEYLDPDAEAANMEKEVKQKTEQTLMHRAAEKLHIHNHSSGTT